MDQFPVKAQQRLPPPCLLANLKKFALNPQLRFPPFSLLLPDFIAFLSFIATSFLDLLPYLTCIITFQNIPLPSSAFLAPSFLDLLPYLTCITTFQNIPLPSSAFLASSFFDLLPYLTCVITF